MENIKRYELASLIIYISGNQEENNKESKFVVISGQHLVHLQYGNMDPDLALNLIKSINLTMDDPTVTRASDVLYKLLPKLNENVSKETLDTLTLFVEYDGVGHYRHSDYPESLLRADADLLTDLYEGGVARNEEGKRTSILDKLPGETRLAKSKVIYTRLMEHHHNYFTGPMSIKINFLNDDVAAYHRAHDFVSDFKSLSSVRDLINEYNRNVPGIIDYHVTTKGFPLFTQSVYEKLDEQDKELDKTGVNSLYPHRYPEEIIFDYLLTYASYVNIKLDNGGLEVVLMGYDCHVDNLPDDIDPLANWLTTQLDTFE